MVELLDTWISHVGPVAYLVLLVAAALEYVVPPFPGDTVVLMGGIYAVRGDKPWWLVFAAVTIGSVIGAAINFQIGRWIDARVERRLGQKTVFGISLERLHAVEAKMRQRGAVLILLNRFIPGIRGLFFVAAGMSHMRRRQVLSLGAVSAMLHTAVMLALGIALGGNMERLEALMNQYQRVAIGLMLVIALALVVRFVTRRRTAVDSE
jgi:membrane protein DedA with SNARE-associated domain